MAKRGRIIRDPTAGAGLVIVHGRQHSFGLERVWRSDALPRPGVVVDVEFDDAGRVVAMMAVPETRLAREQAEAAIALATTKSAGVIARLGWPQLVALALLVLAWFWLVALSFDDGSIGRSQVTLWHALGLLRAAASPEALRNVPDASSGLYGLGAVVCLAAPLLICVWDDRRAHLAALLPLGFMLAVAVPLTDVVRQTTATAGDISLGAGTYLALLASLCLALIGIKRFLVATARDARVFFENQ